MDRVISVLHLNSLFPNVDRLAFDFLADYLGTMHVFHSYLFNSMEIQFALVDLNDGLSKPHSTAMNTIEYIYINA